MPEIVPELRAEIRAVLAENNNVFTSTALQGMKKLDSFLKETLRLYGVNAGASRSFVFFSLHLSSHCSAPRV